MLRNRLLALIALAVATVFAVGCSRDAGSGAAASPSGSPTAATSATATATETPVPVGTRFGIAGLIPRNFPNATADDYIAMYEASAEAGTLLGAYGNWTDDNTSPGEIPEVFRSSYAAVEQFGAPTPVVAVGFASEDVLTGVMQTNVDWSDPTEVQRFSEVVLAIVEEYEPPFFILGAEINRIWEQYPENFDALVVAWPDLYRAVKAASPDTEVGASFQYEFLRGAGYLSGQTRSAHWEIVDRFEGSLDFVALSTYPFFDYETPEAIPDSYYREAAERFRLPLAFSEMGWPSRPLAPFPESGYGGSEEEQAAFATRFLELIEDVDVRFALWSFQFDVGEAGGPTFESVSLRENDGTPKPALDIWIAASD